MKRLIHSIPKSLVCLFMFALPLLNSCEEPESQKIRPEGYFPMEESFQWKYRQSFITENQDPIIHDLSVSIDGEMEIDGKKYKKFVHQDGTIAKLVRKEGFAYFGMNHEQYKGFTNEYKFLDEYASLGQSWSYLKDGGETKTEYVVKAYHLQYVLNGKMYHNVIEMEVNYYRLSDAYQFKVTSKHFYALGIGEIHNFYPAKAAGVFLDQRNDLVTTNF